MPLTDFYAFNGWTLHFFNTPRQGLARRLGDAARRMERFTLYAESHRFRPTIGRIDYGKELDARPHLRMERERTVRLQHARYDPGAGTPDPRIRKTWITFTWIY
jgi:hypothetical protein